MDKRTQDFSRLLAAFLGAIGQVAAVPSVEVTQADEGIYTVTINAWGIGCDIGVPVEVKSIGFRGMKTQSPGYRVFYLKVYHATRWEPEDVEDVTHIETLSVGTALAAMGALWIGDTVEGMLMADSESDVSEPI